MDPGETPEDAPLLTYFILLLTPAEFSFPIQKESQNYKVRENREKTATIIIIIRDK